MYQEIQRVLDRNGIIFLTGESDALSMRHLYDLTEDGLDLVESFLQVSFDRESMPRAWNSRGVYSVYSMLMTANTARDLAVYILRKSGNWVVDADGTISAYDDEDFRKLFPEYFSGEINKDHYAFTWRIYKPCDVDRNIHQFSGRSK